MMGSILCWYWFGLTSEDSGIGPKGRFLPLGVFAMLAWRDLRYGTRDGKGRGDEGGAEESGEEERRYETPVVFKAAEGVGIEIGGTVGVVSNTRGADSFETSGAEDRGAGGH